MIVAHHWSLAKVLKKNKHVCTTCSNIIWNSEIQFWHWIWICSYIPVIDLQKWNMWCFLTSKEKCTWIHRQLQNTLLDYSTFFTSCPDFFVTADLVFEIPFFNLQFFLSFSFPEKSCFEWIEKLMQISN